MKKNWRKIYNSNSQSIYKGTNTFKVYTRGKGFKTRVDYYRGKNINKSRFIKGFEI